MNSRPLNDALATIRRFGLTAVALLASCAASHAAQHTWQMVMTVDNEYDVYFGDDHLSNPTFVGGDNDWTTTDTLNISGVSPSDYLYVATASDSRTAQGFLGSFTNLTTGSTFHTGAGAGTPWEVFPAGQYLAQLNAIDPTIPAGAWPRPALSSIQPTMSQVQTAVDYATQQGLWVSPSTAPGYLNSNNPQPWGTRSGIPGAAEWIWHDTGRDPFATVSPPAPFGNFDHDEFLVFRVPGVVPEPSTFAAALLGLCSISAVGMRARLD